jgi:hypothetical protein
MNCLLAKRLLFASVLNLLRRGDQGAGQVIVGIGDHENYPETDGGF